MDLMDYLKFFKESKSTLAQFIDVAAKLGMPVGLLHKVQKQYSIIFEAGSGTDNVQAS